MKIALLIGVSAYTHLNPLHACKRDIETMKALLERVGTYQDIYVSLDENRPATEVKTSIAQWIKGYQDQEVEEILVYYTGHGDYSDEEFYFLLQNFEHSKRHETSLTNSELDVWLRQLNPILTVKIIDACNSGVPYLKEAGKTIEKYLSASRSGFQWCIFMFSSTTNQTSCISRASGLSDFTDSFVYAVQSSNEGVVRYKDIIDRIVDDFENSAKQTPVFVTQATFHEVFCTLDLKRQQGQGEPLLMDAATIDSNRINKLDLKQVIQKDAERYVSREKALEILEELQTRLSQYVITAKLSELYRYDVSIYGDLRNMPYIKSIGRWLLENRHSYFAEPTHRYSSYSMALAMEAEITDAAYEPPQPTLKNVDGFSITVQVPFKSFRLFARRRFLNLAHHGLFITYLLSRENIKLFYLYAEYRDTDWDNSQIMSDAKWQFIDIPLSNADEVWTRVHEIIAKFENNILDRLERRFGLENE